MTALDLAAIFARTGAPSPFRRCSWCGWPCYGNACAGHRDLTELLHAQTQSPQPHHLDVERAAAGFDNQGG